MTTNPDPTAALIDSAFQGEESEAMQRVLIVADGVNEMAGMLAISPRQARDAYALYQGRMAAWAELQGLTFEQMIEKTHREVCMLHLGFTAGVLAASEAHHNINPETGEPNHD